MRTLVLLTLLGAACGERWKYAGTCYGYFVNYYDFDQDRGIRGNRGNANHRFATDQTTGCFNAVVTGGRGSFSMKFWKDDVQQGGIVATAYGNFANLALTADAVADGWTKTGSTLCPPGAIIDPAWKVQRDAAFEQKKQENLDQARTNFNQEVQQIQLTREQILAQKKQEAKQRSCDAFAGRVNAMGHLNADRKQKVIDNFFSRMGCMGPTKAIPVSLLGKGECNCGKSSGIGIYHRDWIPGSFTLDEAAAKCKAHGRCSGFALTPSGLDLVIGHGAFQYPGTGNCGYGPPINMDGIPSKNPHNTLCYKYDDYSA